MVAVEEASEETLEVAVAVEDSEVTPEVVSVEAAVVTETTLEVDSVVAVEAIETISEAVPVEAAVDSEEAVVENTTLTPLVMVEMVDIPLKRAMAERAATTATIRTPVTDLLPDIDSKRTC